MPGSAAARHAATPPRSRLSPLGIGGIALLFLGTNNIPRLADPLSPGTMGGFSVAAGRILDWLRAWTDLVLVAAVPLLGPEAALLHHPAAAEAYSAALPDLCERPECRYFDPFTEARDGRVGLTTQVALPDGVHLRNCEILAAELTRLLWESGPVRQPMQVRP